VTTVVIGATPATGGHPLWHLAVVAGAAVGVFGWIKLQEHRQSRRSSRPAASRSLRARLSDRAPWPKPRDLYVTAALCSTGAAVIHATVCPEHFREAIVFGVFFAVAAALQAAWTVLLWHRPTRRLLQSGAIGNAAVIMLWVLSRTSGLPIGPERWHPEAITTADILATVLELIVVGATTVLVTHERHATPAYQRRH
jgi:hypothetical protein